MLLHINPTRQRGKRTGSLARASGWYMTFFAAGVIRDDKCRDETDHPRFPGARKWWPLPRHSIDIGTCRSGSGCHTLEPFEETKDRTELNQRDQSEMKEQPQFAAELEFVKELAREAAVVAISRAKRVTPVEKANHSFVTDLDQELEQLIRRRWESGTRTIV